MTALVSARLRTALKLTVCPIAPVALETLTLVSMRGVTVSGVETVRAGGAAADG